MKTFQISVSRIIPEAYEVTAIDKEQAIEALEDYLGTLPLGKVRPLSARITYLDYEFDGIYQESDLWDIEEIETEESVPSMEEMICITREEFHRRYHPEISREDCDQLYYPIRVTDIQAKGWKDNQ
jgi:hypothetical protein